jgi:hypothetical protein
MKPKPHRELDSDEQDYAIKTWRYLRLGMVGLVAGLAVSILYEFTWANDFDCLQRSISAYYYTPVRSFFVAALVGIGVALFCLKGSTEREDILLNLAGIFAPFVAFVPTSDPNRCSSSVTPAPVTEDDARNEAIRAAAEALQAGIVNNVTALLFVGLVAAAVLRFRLRKDLSKESSKGYWVAAGVWIALATVFFADDKFFATYAHNVTAIAMFFFIFVVVSVNAKQYKEDPANEGERNPYKWIAILMAVSAVATVIAVVGFGKGYSVLVIEVILIALFTRFWLIQTSELREAGLRPARPATAAGS